jgi:hypothetical protein
VSLSFIQSNARCSARMDPEARIIMRPFRASILRGVICGVLCCAATAHSSVSLAQASSKPATASVAAPAQVQIDLLRGLADIFSRGMDTLTDKLSRRGYSARVYSTSGWQTVARRTADRYFRGHKEIIVIIGHSLGANATFDVANYLNQHNVPVELVVTFDATDPRPVPKNVLHLVNFYQHNGFGKKVVPGPDFKGDLSNVDLTADTGLSHTTIEKSPRLHAMVMQKIEDIVNADLAKRVKASKPKSKKRK